MLTANSAAILTDAFPLDQRGFALGINQVAALAGQFIGLVAGGLLAAIDWRAVFWVNVPVGVFGTVWAYRKLRDNGERHPGRIDWWGNITFAVGLGGAADRHHQRHPALPRPLDGLDQPAVDGLLIGGVVLLVGVRRDREPGGRADVRAARCSGSGPSPPATSPDWPSRSPAAACSSC